MWIAFTVLLVLWFVSVSFYFPPALIFALFAGMLLVAAAAVVVPARPSRE